MLDKWFPQALGLCTSRALSSGAARAAHFSPSRVRRSGARQ